MDQVVNVSVSDVRAQNLGAYIAQGQGATRTTAGTFTSGDSLANLLGGSGALGDAASANFRLVSGNFVRINNTAVYEHSGTDHLVDAATLARNINNNENLRAIGIEARAVNTSTANVYSTNPLSGGVVTGTATGSANKSATVDLNFYIGDGTKRFTISNFASVSGTSGQASVTTMSLDNLVSAINSQASARGVPIVAMNDGGRLKLVTTNGETIAIEARVAASGAGANETLDVNINYSQLLQGASGTAVQHNFTAATTRYSAAAKVGRVTIGANESFNLAHSGVSGAGEGLNFDPTGVNLRNLYTIDLSTNEGAERAMMIVSKALQKVDTLRSQIGAVMNNLQSIFDAQKVSYDNTKQAESVIRNTDYAEEMSNFTTLQIKMQSTIAMLAQANTLPQLVLQLLR
jgi:flagellin